jgi:hypothetical protein
VWWCAQAEERNEELVSLKAMSKPDALLHKFMLQGRRELTMRARRRSEVMHDVRLPRHPPPSLFRPDDNTVI